MFVTFSVLKLLRSRLVRLQYANIQLISVTFVKVLSDYRTDAIKLLFAFIWGEMIV
jgi:hypothetical protein